MSKTFLLALSTLVGTIVGAGIFSLPYAFEKSGVIPGIFYFLLIGAMVLLLHLLWGEVCLRTSEKHRIIGYAKLYLGEWAKLFTAAVLLFTLAGVLLAYLILGGQFLKIVFSPVLSMPAPFFSVIFWVFLALLISQGIQLISRAELFLNAALFGALGLIFFFAAPHVQLHNFTLFSRSGFFVPFGILFFAMAGWDAIPEIAEFFKKQEDKERLEKVIVWASVITVALFLLFSFFVVGVSGSLTTQDAIAGLEQFLGKPIVWLGALVGVLAIATSFLVLGNYLKNALIHDFSLPRPVSLVLAFLLPLALFLLGFREFIKVIGVVGTLMGAVEGTLMVGIFHQAKTKGNRTPEYSIPIPPFFLFLLAVVLIAGSVAALIF